MFTAKKNVLVIFSLLMIAKAGAQTTDTISPAVTQPDRSISKIKWNTTSQQQAFPAKKFILPGILIAYGFSTMATHGVESINGEIKEAAFSDHPHKKIHIDNYLQFAPALTVYGLNAVGIKGKNNLRDRSMIFLMSNIFVNTTVFSLKSLTKELRPDNSARSSFPSGHTAEAFANAEFLRMEYKDVSPWYGVAGYAIAATTGYLRMYNNKHWLSDVVAGAGVGIASTRLAYWLYPKIQHKLFKDKPVKTVWMPSYQQGGLVVGMVHTF